MLFAAARGSFIMHTKTIIQIVTLALAVSASYAQEPAKDHTIGAAESYDVSSLPDDHYGRLVRYGKELTERTFAYIGPEVKNPKKIGRAHV